MVSALDLPLQLLGVLYENIKAAPLHLLLSAFLVIILSLFVSVYFALFILAPTPRSPYESEKTYITTTPSGSISSPKPLSCWHDSWLAYKKKCQAAGDFEKYVGAIDDAEVEMSVVIPAYNEEKRLEGMLEEAVGYLEATYSRSGAQEAKGETLNISNGNIKAQRRNRNATPKESGSGGYEILLVNDGSKDKTVQVALDFSQRHNLHDIMRIITLKENRGKGGAVTHGFRHARGAYVVFADADGASRFTDLGKLVAGCKEVEDGPSRYGRGVAVGSRAHLVGSEAVVKRSALRNALMRSFHMLLKIFTPPATSRIRDTQCGFKLFSRGSLPYIIPYMHAEGWIFDVEMLMLAESAPEAPLDDEGSGAVSPGIKVAEVPIGWNEVGGSKLNVMWDSLGMAWGLALLRASWALGVYRRR